MQPTDDHRYSRHRPSLLIGPRWTALAAAGLIFSTACCSADEFLENAVPSLQIERGELSVLLQDNSQSPGLLSGIQTLRNLVHAAAFDAFDPDARGASAGLNFEHIISGHRNPNNKFTPRHGRYLLYRSKSGRSAKLVRRHEESPWKIASELEYRLAPPNAVDFEFRCTPQDADLFGDRGYAIFFFANYMNDFEDVALHFRGVEEHAGPERWIAAAAPAGHRDWNQGGTYRHRDAADLQYDADQEFRLNNWSYDYPRFTQPFYYGRAAGGMVLILMFDTGYSELDEIRFSLFKFKVPRRPRPAWDFQYVIHRVASGQEYGFAGRLVWKKFISADDCLREYETWKTDRKTADATR